MTALTLIDRAKSAITKDWATDAEQTLVEAATKYLDIVQVMDKAGRDQAHGAAMELRTLRLSVEKSAKAARDDATAFSKAVIAEEKRLVAIVAPEEDRLRSLRDAWDDEQERIKQAEAQRKQAIEDRIQRLKSKASSMAGQSSESIGLAMSSLLNYSNFDADFQERAAEARALVTEVINTLAVMRDDAKAAEEAAEKDRQRIAAERAELEAMRKRIAEIEAREAAIQAAEAEAERKQVAEIETREVAEAVAETAIQAAEPDFDDDPFAVADKSTDLVDVITLGEIKRRIGFQVTEEFLDKLGVKPKNVRTARMYRASDFCFICAEISKHCLSIADKYK